MGYVPPHVWIERFEREAPLANAYRALYLGSGAPARFRQSFEQYRYGLYGPRRREWLPVASWGLVVTVLGSLAWAAFALLGTQ